MGPWGWQLRLMRLETGKSLSPGVGHVLGRGHESRYPVVAPSWQT